MNGGVKMQVAPMEIKLKFIHGFSNKTRLLILETIRDKEKTVSEIVDALNGNQSNISQHIACLKGCGLIVGRQEGKFIYYSLRNKQIGNLLTMFDTVLDDVKDNIAACQSNLEE